MEETAMTGCLYRLYAAFALAAVFHLGAWIQAAQAAPSYPLACRGGMNMTMEIWHNIAGKAWLIVTFGRAAQAAGSVAPGTGQCGWLDRPPATDEPIVFAAGFAGVIFVPRLWADGRLKELGVTTVPGTIDSAARERKRQAEEIVRAIQGGTPFQLHVTQGTVPTLNQRALIVTRVGP
jgi:hypothetical protein